MVPTPLPRRVAGALALLAAALLPGCAVDTVRPSVAGAGGLLRDTARTVLEIGAAEQQTHETALAVVLGARLTDDGAHVVVLDNAPPFVKVFRRDGTLRAAFLRRGGGPGEAERPSALAVAGDSLVLVADAARRLSLFTLDGELRREAAAPGLPVLGAASVCGDEWLLYAPRFSGSRRAAWVHRVRFAPDGSLRFRTALDDSVSSPAIAMGAAHGVAAGNGAGFVRHALGTAPVVVRWACDAPAPAVVARPERADETAASRDRDGRLRSGVWAGARVTAGMVALQDGLLVAEMIAGTPPEPGTTELTLLRGGGQRRVRIDGEYRLRDAKPGVGVLLSTSDPVPRVFALREADLLRVFPE